MCIFEKDNMLDEVGGTEYLVKLTRFSSSIKQAIDYAKIIHEMYFIILLPASLPSQIAVTTKSEPLTISPPENTFSLEVS